MERVVLSPTGYLYFSDVRLISFRLITTLYTDNIIFPGSVGQVNALRSELKELGLVPETTYLYMQGHHVMDNVVMKLLIPVCTALRREREQEIKRLAEHNEQFRNELTCYQNSQVNVEIMLKKNVAYKRLFHYDWLRQDIQEYLAKEK